MALKDRLSAGEDALPGDESAREAALVARYREQLLAEIDLRELSALDETARRVRLERVMDHLLSREVPVLTARERARTIRRVLDEALGLGILEPLLADESVTEIMVNGPAPSSWSASDAWSARPAGSPARPT